MDAYVEKENPDGGGGKRQTDPDGYLTDLTNMFKKAMPTNNAGSGSAALRKAVQRFPSANKEAIKKIIELQTMLVNLRVAPARLKNGKSFIDGIFGDSTAAAIKKLYR